ncbi:MAG: toll/interleukin-1 receptor domain-containing protein [Terriglobia bacterium]
MATNPADNRYEAFISYSHVADGNLAPQLQSALHGFAKPWYRLRAIRVFRDKTSLSATPSLWPSIEAALRNSKFLLFLASPDAAKSHWVNKEIETFLQLAGPKRLLIVLTEGELEWNEATADFDWRRTNAFPQLGRPVFEEEPLWVDLRALRGAESVSLRNPDFRDAVARLSSAVRDIPTDQLIGEDIRQHRKTMRLLWSALALFAVLAGGLALAGFYSYRKGVEAYNSGVAAQAAARRTRSEFMVSAATTLENDDPLTSALVLSELDDSYQSDRALALLRRVANELPVAVLPGIDPKFSADGSRVLTFPNDAKTVLLWSVDALEKPLILTGHGGSIIDAAVDGQGRRVAIASDDHTVTVWDIDSGREVAAINGYAPTYAD